MKALDMEYAQLSSPELEQLLLEELDKKSPDRDTALVILNILEERDKASSKAAAPSRKPKTRFWIRAAASAAAFVLAFTLAAPPVFGANNIAELVGRWTEDLFALFRPDDPADLEPDYVFETGHPGLQQLHDTAVANGITEPVVPMWVPERCELVNMEVSAIPTGTRLSAYFSDGKDYISFRFASLPENRLNLFTNESKNVTTVEIAGTLHYFVQNQGTWKSIWYTDNTECTILTTYDKITLESIIKNIYLGVHNE